MSSNPFIIGLQGDPTTWALPPAGKTAFGVNLSGEFCSKQSDGTITVLNLGAVAVGEPVVNSGGTTNVGTLNPVNTQQITINGSSRTVSIVLLDAGASGGFVQRLKLFLASVPGYLVQVWDGSTSGTLLYQFTSDGTAQTATCFAQFSYDDGWELDSAQLPAY